MAPKKPRAADKARIMQERGQSLSAKADLINVCHILKFRPDMVFGLKQQMMTEGLFTPDGEVNNEEVQRASRLPKRNDTPASVDDDSTTSAGDHDSTRWASSSSTGTSSSMTTSRRSIGSTSSGVWSPRHLGGSPSRP